MTLNQSRVYHLVLQSAWSSDAHHTWEWKHVRPYMSTYIELRTYVRSDILDCGLYARRTNWDCAKMETTTKLSPNVGQHSSCMCQHSFAKLNGSRARHEQDTDQTKTYFPIWILLRKSLPINLAYETQNSSGLCHRRPSIETSQNQCVWWLMQRLWSVASRVVRILYVRTCVRT